MASERAWKTFFEDAGLPPKIVTKYTLLFLDHRIQREMLVDLTKSILNEVGITAVGDVLAILKQAKAVSNKEDIDAKESNQQTKAISIDDNDWRKVAKELLTSKAPKAATAPKAVTSPKAVTAPLPAAEEDWRSAWAKRAPQTPPDRSVDRPVPQGPTERSRDLIKKAAVISNKAAASKHTSVFLRLGPQTGDFRGNSRTDEDEEDDDETYLSAVPLRFQKSVSFATGTKESSPEVSSTTDEYFGKLESDKLQRKQSALQRLGTRPTNDVVKVVGGERKLLIAKRNQPIKKSIFERLG